MDNTCKICNEKFADAKLLHKHFKTHGIKIEDYYYKYYDKRDLFSGEVIKFKNREQYLNKDFISRSNLIKWIQSVKLDTAQTYMSELLIRRKVKKNLIYSPTQIELKSVMMPSIALYDKLFKEGYYNLCNSIGLQNKHHTIHNIDQIDLPYKIQIDTREQNPLTFKDSISEKLDFGDYKIFNDNYSVYFERKSLTDLVGTLSSGIDRFTKEIERAKNDYLIIIVEKSLKDSLSFNDSHVYGKTKITPEFIFRQIRDLMQKYKNIQFLFVNGRKECERTMIRIFKSNNQYKTIDLQLAYDSNIL